MSVENGYINCDFCYTNSCNVYVIKNHNIIDYTKKRDEFSTNRHLRENNGFPDGVEIGDMSPEYALNQYVNMEYNKLVPSQDEKIT